MESEPVSVVEMVNVRELLNDSLPISAGDIETLQELLCGPQASQVRSEVGAAMAAGDATEAVRTRLGIACYLLADHERADKCLRDIVDSATGIFHHGKVLSSLGRYTESEERFEHAARIGADKVDCALFRAGALRAQGKVDDSEKLLRSVAAEAASRAEYSFQMGCVWSDRGDALTAIEYFERAADMDPHHSRALFRLAAENSLRGNDDEAVRLYEQALSKPPFFMGAVLNLGLLYEDKENYPAAAYCFRRVLEFDPLNERAALYLKDIDATQDMYYDEDSARHEARMQQLLARPVTDFELSVRSRNCLQSMDIDTLGDLTEISEQELLAGKNFGETSLHEIREVLTTHGLRIGQHLHRIPTRDAVFEQNLSPEEQALMGKGVAELNLSVRARKCMVRLGIATIGQLVQRTPDELLSSRNFGVTSLNEIRARLSDFGVKLRND